MPKNTREFIGEVGVDSGQVMIIDPCYIESEWKNKGKVTRVEFWGAAQNAVRDELRRVYPKLAVITGDTGSVSIPVSSAKEASTIIRRIDKIMFDNSLVGLMRVTKSTNSYDECCEVTLSHEGAGQFLDGMAVVSSTAMGDGVYPVYATYDGHGRVSKLEIEFSDEE